MNQKDAKIKDIVRLNVSSIYDQFICNTSHISPLKSVRQRRLTNDAVPGVELGGVAKATVGMEVCKAGQPHPSVSVREGEGDAVGAGLRDRVPPFHVGVHGVGGLRGAVHPGGLHGVLVVVLGDLRRCHVNTETEG